MTKTSKTANVFSCAFLAFGLLASSAPARKPPETGNNIQSLRLAIEDLSDTFGKKYPRGKEFLKRLDALEKKSKAGTAPAKDVDDLAMEALTANPFVSGQPILYVTRRQYRSDHHNTETMFQTGECNTHSYEPGGPLRTVNFGKTGEVCTLVDPGPTGLLRDPDVSWDGSKIVFSMRKSIKEDYHLYDVNADGANLRVLTSAEGVFDIDPAYLPDGRIVFSSSREPKYCMCNIHIMGNLFVMEADGANIHQIGRVTLHEGHPSIMPDGRILYDRWEYVDRNFGDPQGLWTVNPDGTSHSIYYGNNTPSPGAILDGRTIPGTDFVICIFAACHDRPWGALAIIDRSRGVDGRQPVMRTWPADAIDLVRDPGEANNVFDLYGRVRPKYEDPFPLSDPKTGAGGGKYFLCSRTTGHGEEMGICLLDIFGNELIIHTDDKGCYDPMPLAPRKRPPVIPTRRDFKSDEGTFYVQNVYAGTHMKGVTNGAVKFLRVVESPPKRFWTKPAWGGQGVERPGMNWHSFDNKIILGTVPVEADGSANFTLPSDKFVYFQLLDGNGMMIQSMRSGTTIQSGERTGCVGCHESRLNPPVQPPARQLMALKRQPSQLSGWYGPAREFSYLRDVQPVFNRHCMKCHDYGKEAAEKLNLACDRGLIFNVSYVNLWRKWHSVLRVVGAGPAEIQEAYSWGSHASRLTKIFAGTNAHHNVKLSREEFDRIATWVDLNAVYYPSYASSYPDNDYGRCPLDDNQLAKLQNLGVGKDIIGISFDRPELSPGLEKLAKGSDQYNKALAIIRAGQESLKKNPNPDTEGFVPCEVDQARLKKYEMRKQIEEMNRKAINDGKKLYDPQVKASPGS